MLGIRTGHAGAEAIRKYLKERKLLDKRYRIIRRNSFIYFPILRSPTYAEKSTIVRRGGAQSDVRFSSGTPASADLEKGKRAGYDILGNIAVIDAEPGSVRALARHILETHKNVRTVLRKGGGVEGIYRVRRYVCTAGRRDYVARYNENGCSFTFDLKRVFFSPRLAYERKRISELVSEGEHVVVMFAGVGPFAIEMAKCRKSAAVVAIELNRNAYAYMLQNIKANRVSNVVARLGDVRDIAPDYRGFADRIVMPLPKDSGAFVDEALLMARKGCVVHYYTFCERGGAEKAAASLRKSVERQGRCFRLIGMRQVRPYSPSRIEIVVDFEII